MQMANHSSMASVGEPKAPMTDPAPQADDQTRNQVADPTAKDAPGAPKVKSEKECMSLDCRLWMV